MKDYDKSISSSVAKFIGEAKKMEERGLVFL